MLLVYNRIATMVRAYVELHVDLTEHRCNVIPVMEIKII